MRTIKDGSKTSSVERIAVMAALNLAHEFQRERAAPSAAPTAVGPTDGADLAAARRRIAGMHAAIDQVLPGKDRLL
jgi:cell division protein ZapA (FtsZ GTPase activity inhibitor)